MRFKLFAHLERELQKRSGLSDADFSVLFRLWEAPDGQLRLGELGEQLDWTKSRLSKQISRMASRGLLTREICDTDGRGAFAVLTPAGREMIEAASPPHLQDVRRWFVDALTNEQLESLAAAFATILARLPTSP
ncbi:MarR family winged helix-turn-helix transcriptional regulator [Mycobacteroides chelonae]|uniref:MarR family winged helix-turn-helix transcriptional regulator n=1 Tax=Mycobacteroides chelonae TaxID=1774 RepID=UPI001F43F526|nr:MarR family winged helix-turn-helix transcriptional regulator [Mycobacteroides chelonae]